VSAIDLNCYEDIIALSQTDCECFDDNYYKTTKSGLTLDQLEGLNLNMVNAGNDCAYGGLWQRMDTARDNAIRIFIGDTNSKLLEFNRLKRQPFNGTIGRRIFKNTRSPAQIYAGVRWYCADIVSGVVKIKKIGTLFAATGTVTLFVYNQFNELLHTIVLNTTANTLNVNDITDIELPLHVDYINNPEYFFIYQVDPTNYPKDITLDCNCSGTRYPWNVDRPYFMTQSNRRDGWANFMMVGGFETNTLDFMDIGFSTSNYLNGLLMEVEMKCKIEETICMNEIDFQANPLGASIAFAIRYIAGAILLEDLMASGNLSRTTMINMEQAAASAAHYREEYDRLLNFIVKKVEVTANDCFECDDLTKMIVGGILAT
jgi:hypothetical protein